MESKPLESDAESEATEVVSGERAKTVFRPDKLLAVMPEEYSPRQRLIIAMAVRNPSMSYKDLSRLLGMTKADIKEVLGGFSRNTLGYRGSFSDDDEPFELLDVDLPSEYERTFDGLTEKQKAIIDLLARWPAAYDELSSRRLADLVHDHSGVAVSASYPKTFMTEYADLPEVYREALPDEALPPNDLPVIGKGEPSVSERLAMGPVNQLPESNLDDGMATVDWVEAYADQYDIARSEISDDDMTVDSPTQPSGDEYERDNAVVLHCPVEDCAYTGETPSSLGPHIGQAHSQGEIREIVDAWLPGGLEEYESDTVTAPLWVAAFMYTASIEEDLDITDVMLPKFAMIVDEIRRDPEQPMSVVANRLGVRREEVRSVHRQYGFALPDEWHEHRDRLNTDPTSESEREPLSESESDSGLEMGKHSRFDPSAALGEPSTPESAIRSEVDPGTADLDEAVLAKADELVAEMGDDPDADGGGGAQDRCGIEMGNHTPDPLDEQPDNDRWPESAMSDEADSPSEMVDELYAEVVLEELHDIVSLLEKSARDEAAVVSKRSATEHCRIRANAFGTVLSFIEDHPAWAEDRLDDDDE